MWDYCSIWWCLYASAFVKAKETQDWCAKYIHPSVSIGKGAKRAEEMASNLQEAYMSGGFAASSDWTQAYDCMKPEITTKTLTLWGFPPGSFCHFRPAWTEQIRWTSYEGHTRPVPLKSRATPQRCPITPMVLAIWSSAFCLHGWQMTMHCKQLHGISDAIEAWHHWSERMGLRESPEKKKSGLWKNQNSKLRTLKGTLAGHIPTSKCLNQCFCWAFLLFPKPVAGGLQTGPLGRLQKNDLAPLFTQLSGGAHCIPQSGKHLFPGAHWSPNLTLLTRTWGWFRRQVERNGFPQWGNSPHTTIALRSQPRKIGFVEASPFVWHPPRCWADACPTERLQLNLKNLQQDVNLQLHNIRSFYRCQPFDFLAKAKAGMRVSCDNSCHLLR